MIILAGPTWSRDKDRLDYIMPWKLEAGRSRENVEKDSFRVPIPPASASRDFSMRLSQPTILIPTCQNIVGLLDTIRSFQSLSSGLIQRLRWARRQLYNGGAKYDIRVCLEAKKEAAESILRYSSLLQEFLSQTEPPEWQVETGDADELEPDSELDVFNSNKSETDDDDDDGTQSLSDGFGGLL